MDSHEERLVSRNLEAVSMFMLAGMESFYTAQPMALGCILVVLRTKRTTTDTCSLAHTLAVANNQQADCGAMQTHVQSPQRH